MFCIKLLASTWDFSELLLGCHRDVLNTGCKFSTDPTTQKHIHVITIRLRQIAI